MTLVLDAGALVAVERGSRELVARIKGERLLGRAPVTHGGVVGQVWRGGSGRQARLAQLLPHAEVVSLGAVLGKRAGTLLSRAASSDVIDAAVVLLAEDDDLILTSDPDDLVALAAASGTHVEIVPV
ncbi:MAG: PIN domain-containing protein [Stackebrandtia sp.]